MKIRTFQDWYTLPQSIGIEKARVSRLHPAELSISSPPFKAIARLSEECIVSDAAKIVCANDDSVLVQVSIDQIDQLRKIRELLRQLPLAKWGFHSVIWERHRGAMLVDQENDFRARVGEPPYDVARIEKILGKINRINDHRVELDYSGKYFVRTRI